MLRYHIDTSLFVRPSQIEQMGQVTLRGIELPILDTAALARGEQFLITFEQAAAALADLLRMDIEPDGYFVWSREDEAGRWQVDGHLFDRSERLWRVDLRGSCLPDRFDELVACFGWPETVLVFQLVREGVTLDEADFRRWAEAPRSV